MTVRPREADLAVGRTAAAEPTHSAQYAQRRVWVFIGVAFAVWCTIFTTAFIAANTWRKTTYSAPAAQLVSKRGIILYQGPRDERPVSIAEPTDLEEGGVLDFPYGSEAVIQLRVDNSTITLRPGSRVRLATMRVGRFSSELTQVRFEQLEGAVNYTVSGELPSNREVEVKTPHMPEPSDLVKLTKGEYLVWVQPGGTRLISYHGQAKAEVGASTFRLRDGRWVVIDAGRPDLRQPLDLPEQLIKNRDFSRGFEEYWSPIDVGERGRPDVGGTRSIVEELITGRPTRALRITRDTARDTHNETGLSQEINRDVSAYRGITFSAWVKVIHASLDGGGYMGSEYPMMFRVHYVGENGGSYIWAHGFYASNPTNRRADIGEQIPAGQWHRFVLDMNTLKERPAYISKVEVLASGHDYDAEVANVQLAVE